MKKIKLLASLSTLGVLSSSVAAIATGCSDNSLTIRIESGKTEIGQQQATEWVIGLYSGEDQLDLDSVSATSNDNSIAKAVMFSNKGNKVTVIGEKKGVTTISITAQAVNGKSATFEQEIAVSEGSASGYKANIAGIAVSEAYDGTKDVLIASATFEDATHNEIKGSADKEPWDLTTNGTIGLNFTASNLQAKPTNVVTKVLWDSSATKWNIFIPDSEASGITSENNGSYNIDFSWTLKDGSAAEVEGNLASITINVAEEEVTETLDAWSDGDYYTTFIAPSANTQSLYKGAGIWNGVDPTDSDMILSLESAQFPGEWSGEAENQTTNGKTNIPIYTEGARPTDTIYLDPSGGYAHEIAFYVPQGLDTTNLYNSTYTIKYTGTGSAEGKKQELSFVILPRSMTIGVFHDDGQTSTAYDGASISFLGDSVAGLGFRDDNYKSTQTSNYIIFGAGFNDGFFTPDPSSIIKGVLTLTVRSTLHPEEYDIDPEKFNSNGEPLCIVGYNGTPGESNFEVTCISQIAVAGTAISEYSADFALNSLKSYKKYIVEPHFVNTDMPQVTLKANNEDGSVTDFLNKYAKPGHLTNGILKMLEVLYPGMMSSYANIYTYWYTANNSLGLFVDFNSNSSENEEVTYDISFLKGETGNYFDVIKATKYPSYDQTVFNKINGIKYNSKLGVYEIYVTNDNRGEITLYLDAREFPNKITIED